MNSVETKDMVLYSMLGLVVVENLLQIYISMRQIKVYRTARMVPKILQDSMTASTFHKARLYGLDREEFAIAKGILMDVAVTSLELYCGIMAYVWRWSLHLVSIFEWDTQNEVVVSCVYVALFIVIGFVKDMPLKIYKTFVLEEKHGFNKQTSLFFIKDQLKALPISMCIMVPISAAVVYIVQRGGEHFFIWLWAFTGVVILMLLSIYPLFIAPLFDTYTPLKEGSLRDSIERLAASLKFPLTKLYVVEGSKRSAHSNAYFYGMWNSKRIVLFDTLLLNKGLKDEANVKEEDKGKGCTDGEVIAVVGHEMGHWKLGHVTKDIILMQIHSLLLFATFGYFFQYAPFYEAVGFAPGQRPILVGLLVISTYVMYPYNAFVNFTMTIISRRFEYQADEFAYKLGFGKQLGAALIKLNLDNLGFPIYDWLYSSWNHSHPTLLQRLDRINELESSNKKSN